MNLRTDPGEGTLALALPAGTVLRRGGDRYILKEAVSFGGSSLFYTAGREGSALAFGVKECCPIDLAGRLHREGGVLTGGDAQADDALAQARKRMLWEAEASQKVANTSAKTIPAWEAQGEFAVETAAGAASAPAGSFLVLRDMSSVGMFLPQLLEECALPPEEGHPLRTGGQPDLHTTARILEQVLRAVELVHEAGYLYGDVQPENIFFADARPEKGDIGSACLLDFGCARPLLDREGGGRETAKITDRMVFTADGYTAPEIAWDNDGNLRLTPAADLYSAGRLLLFLLRGCTYFEDGQDRMLAEKSSLAVLASSDKERLGCTAEEARLLQQLLDRSLEPEPEDRWQTAGEMLAEAERLVWITRPPTDRLTLSCSPLPADRFLGREAQLTEIDRRLRRHCGPVVVWGFAGMGKTELAMQFADPRRYPRGQAHFVRFRNSVRETVTGPIADAFSGYDRLDARGREKPEEQIYREIMKRLGERSENDLLILDNMDGEEGGFDVLQGEPAFRDLCALDMGLLVTTRSPVEDGVEVDTLPLPLLRQLLRRFVPKLSDEMADALIAAVEGHTLTVELLGRTLKTSIPRLRPEVLLEKLTQGDLDSRALAKVSSPKDREGRMTRIQGHLTALFRLSNLPAEEKRLLAYALPISPDGLAAEAFAQVPDFDQDALLRLIDRGWIRRSEDDILTLHPLVQETGWRELDVDIPALIRFSECAITTPALYRCNAVSDGAFARGTGYLRALCRRAERPTAKIYAGARLTALLSLWGRFEKALEQALELLKWLESRPDSDRYPQCMRTVLLLCADGLEQLGRFWERRDAEDYRARAEALNASDQVITDEDELYEPESLPEELAVQIGCIERLESAIAQGQEEAALRLYRSYRKWFSDRGLNAADLDLMAMDIYRDRDDLENYYRTLQRACGEMERWERPTDTQTRTMLSMSACCMARDDPEAGRQWMGRALAMAQRLCHDERNQLLEELGMTAVELARDAGWEEEADAWQAAFDAYESEEIERMRKELEAQGLPDPGSLPQEVLELLGNLGTDSVDIGDLAKIIGWGEDPED